MDKADNEIDFFASWERPIDRTAYFFSFKVDEADVRKKLLEFRESLTINVLPDPSCISFEDIQLRQELTNLLSQPHSFQSLKRLRGYHVPIPIWVYLKEKDNNLQQTDGLRTFTSQDFIYTSKYGLIPIY